MPPTDIQPKLPADFMDKLGAFLTLAHLLLHGNAILPRGCVGKVFRLEEPAVPEARQQFLQIVR
jgi:hypothetical protein